MEEIPLDKKTDLLKNSSLFSRFMERDLKIIAGYSEYQHFKKGEIIFKKGSEREGLFIIEYGEVSITKSLDKGKEINLARYITGDSFGEMDLLKNSSKSANAVAEKDSKLLVFPKEGTFYRDVLQKHPEISARILYKLLATIAGRIRNTNSLISEKSPWINDLRRQLFCDQVTGLYNRSFLENDFAVHLPKYGETTSLLIIKPDNLKEVNDKYGHVAGDKFLRLMAIYIQSILREDDIGVRYKGAELSVILPDTNIEEANKIAVEIKSVLNEVNISNIINKDRNISVSIGVACYPDDADNNLKLIDIACEKMYVARDNGGNQIEST